jgi:hypothetical protein
MQLFEVFSRLNANAVGNAHTNATFGRPRINGRGLKTPGDCPIQD